MRDFRSHLEEVGQQQEQNLPVIPPMPFGASQASSSSYGSVPSSPAPTHHYIGSSPAQSPAPTLKSSPPVSIRSSPQVIQSSPATVRSSSSIEGPFGARSSPSQTRDMTEAINKNIRAMQRKSRN